MNEIIKTDDLFKAKKETKNDIVRQEKKLDIVKKEDSEKKTSFEVIGEQTQVVLQSDAVRQAATLLGSEGVKADFAEEAARINEQNIRTAEREFDTETRQLRLEQLKAELTRQHKHNMEMLEQNARHQEMLDKRKKLEEKYGYLYEMERVQTVEWITKKDDKGNVLRDEHGDEIKEKVEKFIEKPKDFCYSERVNRIRTFTRNISRLDTTIKKIIKWFFIIGIGTVAIILLKKFGILA